MASAGKEITMNQIWEALQRMQEDNASISKQITENRLECTKNSEEISANLSQKILETSENLTLKLEGTSVQLNKQIDDHMSKIESSVDAKLTKHSSDIRSTLDELTNQISINFRRQDEKLNKVKSELVDQLERKVTDIHSKINDITTEINTSITQCKEQVVVNTEELESVKQKYRLLDLRVENVEKRESENAFGVTKRIDELKDSISKTAKNIHSGKTVCGGYREEPTNITFSGLPHENPVEFLKGVENYIHRVNPFMDTEDKFDILNRILKGWANTWWRVVADKVKTYDQFKAKFLGQYWNVQVQRRIRDHLEFGHFDPCANLTPANYVMNVVSHVKHLTPPLEDRDLVYKLARHFSERTRVAATCRGVDTIEGFIMLVDECQDLERELKGVREAPKFNYNTRVNEEGTGGPERNQLENRRFQPFNRDRRSGYQQNRGNPSPRSKSVEPGGNKNYPVYTAKVDPPEPQPSTSKGKGPGNGKGLQVNKQ